MRGLIPSCGGSGRAAVRRLVRQQVDGVFGGDPRPRHQLHPLRFHEVSLPV